MRSLRTLLAALAVVSCTTSAEPPPASSARPAPAAAQAPGWSRDDLAFFLHGSMSAEVVPERVLLAFVRAHPDLFPRADLAHFGLIPDPAFGWPLGFSRRSVAHLGGLSAVGINCAACHLGEVEPAGGGAGVRVLGMTAHFDAEAYFNAVIGATFRTTHPATMARFLAAYLAVGDPAAGEAAQARLAVQWRRQEAALAAAIAADPAGARGVPAGGLHDIAPADLRLDGAGLERGMDLVLLVQAMLRLFHNMRAALHIPDQPPTALPPASGPGRNDAFGLLSLALLGVPQPYAPVKYGLVWNLDRRQWVHWDGNTRSPISRNLLAALGLGAPLLGTRAILDVPAVQRQTDLSEKILAPRYPFAVDRAAAGRGAALYAARCARCHDGAESDARLHAPEAIGTEPARARLFSPAQADGLNALLARIEAPGYQPPFAPGIRGTQRYWAPSLAGVWARSPYLHNGSVRTMEELLTPPAARARSFHRGSRVYDEAGMGFVDRGAYLLDTRSAGNSAAGHEHGTELSGAQRRELIEYLKTL